MLAKEFELAKERQAEFMGDRYCIALANSLNQVLTQSFSTVPTQICFGKALKNTILLYQNYLKF